MASEPDPSHSDPERAWLRSLNPVWALNALLLLGVVASAAWVLPRVASVAAPIAIPWWALAVVFLLSEVYVVHLEVRKEAQSFSLAEVPLVIGLVFTSPAGVLAAVLVGTGAALALHRRQTPIKLLFNVSQTALAACIALIVFSTLLGDAEPVSVRAWAAVLVAVLAATTFSNVMIFLAITLTQGMSGSLSMFLSTSTLASLANAVVGLTAVALMWLYPPAVLLVVSLVGILFLAYRALSSARTQSEELSALYAASHTVLQSPDLDVLVARLLENARVMFKCELVEVMLVAADGSAARSRLTAGGTPVLFEPAELDSGEGGVWARVMAEQRPALVSSTMTGRIATHFAERGVRDGLVAPLVDDGQAFGTLLVANREGSTRHFAETDLELVETFANNVSVAIRNGRLIEELERKAAENEHLAHHDALTELPNRTLFRGELREWLRRRGEEEKLAVLLVDLDRFKEVNDTLGHHNGDLLLQEFARRLQTAVRPGTLLARLGGDEFGIVFATPDTESALERAQMIADDVSKPYSLGDLALDVRATTGVAICPDHGEEPETLLQRADVALYWAKDTHESAAAYSSDHDHYSADRLALAGELRRAIELEQLMLHYQPKVSLVTDGCGRSRGARALGAPASRPHSGRRIHRARRADGPRPVAHGVRSRASAPPGSSVDRR